MSDEARSWRSQSAWPIGRGSDIPATEDPGVSLEPVEDRALATVIVGLQSRDALRRICRDVFAVELPLPGRTTACAALTIVWTAPGQWLFVAEAGRRLADLSDRLANVASVTDQSDARALVRIGGREARRMLAKGLSIDLHPSVFATSHAASTNLAHVAVQLWQTDEKPTYVLAVPRSFASSVWSFLTSASAEHGVSLIAVPT